MILRMKYKKTETGRYLSHLDLTRTIERTFRRAGIPLSFSEGFNPHPKFSFASALAVGISSDAEYLDVELRQDEAVSCIREKLSMAAPEALEILEMIAIHKPARSLSAVINRAKYQASLPLEDPANLALFQTAVQQMLQSEEVWIEVPKQIQIRPWIYQLSVDICENILTFEMLLATGPGGNLKPQDVLNALGGYLNRLPTRPWILHREGLYIQDKAELHTPMTIAVVKLDER